MKLCTKFTIQHITLTLYHSWCASYAQNVSLAVQEVLAAMPVVRNMGARVSRIMCVCIHVYLCVFIFLCGCYPVPHGLCWLFVHAVMHASTHTSTLHLVCTLFVAKQEMALHILTPTLWALHGLSGEQAQAGKHWEFSQYSLELQKWVLLMFI